MRRGTGFISLDLLCKLSPLNVGVLILLFGHRRLSNLKLFLGVWGTPSRRRQTLTPDFKFGRWESRRLQSASGWTVFTGLPPRRLFLLFVATNLFAKGQQNVNPQTASYSRSAKGSGWPGKLRRTRIPGAYYAVLVAVEADGERKPSVAGSAHMQILGTRGTLRGTLGRK